MSARFIRSRWRGIAPITQGETTSREYEAWYDAHAWSPSPESGLVIESDLLPILTRHTTSEHSWFLLWDGFGDLNERVFRPQPRVRHPMRDFYLLSGALNAYRNLLHDPNYWWPDDRAWCLCTDTDFCWAYIAGTAACIREVLSVPELDAYETNPANPARSGMDVINDPHGTVPRTT